MNIPDSYRKIIDPLIAHARALLETGVELSPLAFVGNMGNKTIVPVVMDDTDDESKDFTARGIGITAEATDADYIFCIREAWQLAAKHADEYDKVIEKYGSIGASPYRQDVVVFTLETVHGTWIAMPPIKPKLPSKKKRTIGAVEFVFTPEIEGRFTGLLPKNKGAGSLH